MPSLLILHITSLRDELFMRQQTLLRGIRLFQQLPLECTMNNYHLSDRLSHFVPGSILALATLCTWLTSATSASANTNRVYQPYILPPIPSDRLQAVQSEGPPFIVVQPRLAAQSATPTDTVKRYLKFIRQGIWDHTQQAPRQAVMNFRHAYNLLSEGFKSDVAGDFDKFVGYWLSGCDLRNIEDQIYLYRQVGDTAVVYAPIERTGCSETRVRYLKLKLEPEGRSWQIDVACSTPNDDCRVRSRGW